jgi:hypothetical protein
MLDFFLYWKFWVVGRLYTILYTFLVCYTLFLYMTIFLYTFSVYDIIPIHVSPTSRISPYKKRMCLVYKKEYSI